MAIILAAGKTGGHIFPAIAVAQSLEKKAPHEEIIFVGVGGDIESSLIQEAGFPLEVIPFVPITGAGVMGAIRFLFALPGAICKALRLYSRVRPKVVVGFGGYPAFVPMVTAWLKRIPRILHEQNVQVGLANKILSLLANEVYAVHRAQGFWGKKTVHFIGNPVRHAFEQISEWKAPSSEQHFVLLIVGGSQGAVSLNDAVMSISPTLERLGLKIIHQSGSTDFERVNSHYEKKSYPEADVRAFIDNMPEAYAEAHLIVCRSGAMTTAEVAASGRPAIFVPLHIAGGHQAENVRHLIQCEGGVMLEQGPELAEKLGQLIEELVSDPAKLQQMAARARESTRQGLMTAAEQLAQAAVTASGSSGV